MIDLHNHILPEWDDGPTTIEKSVEMARQAVEAGTKVMLATPHRFISEGESNTTIVQAKIDELTVRLQLEHIPLTILPGVEIPIEFGVVAEVQAGHLSTLGGGNYLLLEPPFPNLPAWLYDALQEILGAGFGVVLAHPERNSIVQKRWMQEHNLAFVEECVKLGCIIQLTSGSIVGRFGPTAQTVSRAIASHRDWKIVIASDSHDPKERSPAFLGQARDTVAEWIGDSATAARMVEDLPAEIIAPRT